MLQELIAFLCCRSLLSCYVAGAGQCGGQEASCGAAHPAYWPVSVGNEIIVLPSVKS